MIGGDEIREKKRFNNGTKVRRAIKLHAFVFDTKYFFFLLVSFFAESQRHVRHTHTCVLFKKRNKSIIG